MNYYYTWFALFAVIAYVIIVDSNVAKYVILLWKLAVVNFHRFIFWVKFYPRLRWDTWNLKRMGEKRARELRKELDMKLEEE